MRSRAFLALATRAGADPPARGRNPLALAVEAATLLDVLTDDPQWYGWSAAQLDACANEAELCINPLIYAEVSVGFERIEACEHLRRRDEQRGGGTRQRCAARARSFEMRAAECGHAAYDGFADAKMIKGRAAAARMIAEPALGF